MFKLSRYVEKSHNENMLVPMLFLYMQSHFIRCPESSVESHRVWLVFNGCYMCSHDTSGTFQEWWNVHI